MSIFAVVRSRGPAWDPARGMEQQADWSGHAAFMDALYAQGFVLLVGPLEGTRDVLLVVRGEDTDQVRARLADDPWERSGLLVVGSVAPWTVRLGAVG
jgi:uncharacterized protein YciI